MKTEGILIQVITPLLFAALALTGCGGGAGGGGENGGTAATLVSILVTPANPNIPLGETPQFTATGTYSDSSTQDLTPSVTWTSSVPTVATISDVSGSKGLAASLTAGSTTITATSGSISGSTTLTVRALVTTLVSISVTPANPHIARGETQEFTATGNYSDSSTGDLTTSVTWVSSAPTVATISDASGSKGLAASLTAGSTTITATSGSITGNTTLTVEAVAAGAVNLPETGQTTSYAARDDGALQKGVAWPSPRFTVSGSCVTDNLTGLMWIGTPDRTTRTWTGAIAYANGLTLCGSSDWRLPNVNELESLLNAGQGNSADWLKTQGFTDVDKVEDYQWSSTTYAGATAYAWSVVMWNGDLLPGPKTSALYAWPVSGGQTATANLPRTGQTASYATGDDGDLQKGVAWPGTRFTVSGECVTDNLTGLMWGKTPDASPHEWYDALAYANNLELCGYTDWRLPNRKELRSLMNYGALNPISWLKDQGFSEVGGDYYLAYYYWTSTTYAFNTLEPIAWYIYMGGGNVSESYKYHYSFVWPVRSGQ